MIRNFKAQLIVLVITAAIGVWLIYHRNPLYWNMESLGNLVRQFQISVPDYPRYPAGNLTLPDLRVDIKVYIYDLPAEYNKFLEDEYREHSTYDLSHDSYGTNFTRYDDGIEFRNTYQGSLDIIFHKRLAASGLVTRDPSQADLFFIPYYHDMTIKAGFENIPKAQLNGVLEGELNKLPYYKQGKPHLMCLGRPKVLKQFHLLFITVENAWKEIFPGPDMIIAPYPSYGHLSKHNGGQYAESLHLHKRRVFSFLAINDRKQNDYPSRQVRHGIFTLIKDHTSRPFPQELKFRNVTAKGSIEEINYLPSEFQANVAANVVEWMRNSVFCPQPPGDTDCRKSFFDAIMCGCIPVIFQLPYNSHVFYPFEALLDYSQFTVKIPSAHMWQYKDVLHKISESSIVQMQYQLRRVLPLLQYNDPTALHVGDDAFSMTMHQVKQHFKL